MGPGARGRRCPSSGFRHSRTITRSGTRRTCGKRVSLPRVIEGNGSGWARALRSAFDHVHGPYRAVERHLAPQARPATAFWHHGQPQRHAATRSDTQRHAAPRSDTQRHAAPRSATQRHAAPRSATQRHVASRDAAGGPGRIPAGTDSGSGREGSGPGGENSDGPLRAERAVVSGSGQAGAGWVRAHRPPAGGPDGSPLRRTTPGRAAARPSASRRRSSCRPRRSRRRPSSGST